MATKYQIELEVKGLTMDYWEKAHVLFGIQYGIYLANDNWYPYGEDDVEQAIKFVFNRSRVNNMITILQPMSHASPSQDKTLKKAFEKKTTIKEAYIYAYPENNILNPLDFVGIKNFKIVHHAIIGESKKLKIPGIFEVYAFQADQII
jgi:hypothetical protein